MAVLVPEDQPGADGTAWLSVQAVWSLCCRAEGRSPPPIGVQVHGSCFQTGPATTPTGYAVVCSSGLQLNPVARRGWTHSLPPSKISTGFPQAPASGCPSEVVRDHTRDTLGNDKEEIPQPLYLFVSLSAIFACVVVYKVLHDTWSYWLGSLGEISRGTW